MDTSSSVLGEDENPQELLLGFDSRCRYAQTLVPRYHILQPFDWYLLKSLSRAIDFEDSMET